MYVEQNREQLREELRERLRVWFRVCRELDREYLEGLKFAFHELNRFHGTLILTANQKPTLKLIITKKF